MAFNDARCPKCGYRIGWVGKLKACPPCDKCGYQIPKESWSKDEAEIEAFRKTLLERKKSGNRDRTSDDPDSNG